MKKLLLIFSLFLQTLYACAQNRGCFTRQGEGIMLQTDIDLSNYNTFFVGEFHGVYGVPEIKLSLIKYLNQHYDVSDVFMEISYSAAWLYNAYLTTGDTAYITNPVPVYALKENNRAFWKNLYQYNKTATHKIIIRGMDFERMEFVKALRFLMPKGIKKPLEILPVLTYIDTATMLNTALSNGDQLNKTYQYIKDDIEQHKEIYKQYYGTSFSTVENIMFNEDTYSKYSQRNTTMYHNVIKQVHGNSINKYIVFSGLNHANKSDKNALANMLRSEDNIADKMCIIAMLCKNCYDIQQAQENKLQPYCGPYTYYKDTALMNNIFSNYTNPNCKYTIIPSVHTKYNKVERYSDFLILMQDQPEY